MPNLSLTTYFRLSILAVIILMSATTFFYYTKYQDAVLRYKLLSVKHAELLVIIKNDSMALDKLGKESKERERKAKLALEAAQRRNRELEKKAQGYLTAKPVSDNMCTSADYLFNVYIRESK